MTLFWAQPPDYPPVAIVPYYLYAIAGKFSVQLMPGHRNAPCAPGGQGWRKGGDQHLKREFLPGRVFYKGIFSRFSPVGRSFYPIKKGHCRSAYMSTRVTTPWILSEGSL